MFCCKETEYCSFVLITKSVERKKTFSILIKLCSLFCQGLGGESSVRKMNEMESRSGQMYKHNQMLQGSRSSGKGLQHSSRKQTVVWHRRGDDVFPWGLRKAARNIIGRNYGRPKSEKGRKKLDWTRKRSKWIRDVQCSLARERIPSGKSQIYLVVFAAERKQRKLNQRTGKVIDPRSPMSSAQYHGISRRSGKHGCSCQWGVRQEPDSAQKRWQEPMGEGIRGTRCSPVLKQKALASVQLYC